MLILKKFDGNSITWNGYIRSFEEHTIYQSFEWGEYKSNFGWSVIRLVGSFNDKKIYAQIFYKKFFFNSYIFWIPGGILGDTSIWASNISNYLKKLFNAKFIYIKTSLAFSPSLFDCNNLSINNWSKIRSKYITNKTLIYNLTHTEEFRINLATGNWRHNLRRSFKKNLSCENYLNPNIDEILEIYKSMQLLKNLKDQFNYYQIKLLIDIFSERLVIIKCCDDKGSIVSIRGALVMGDKAWDILAATSVVGRKIYASYYTFWALMDVCKSKGVKHYDMGGIDPVNNKGVYDFKKGTGATEVTYLGDFDYSNSIIFKSAVRLYSKFRVK